VASAASLDQVGRAGRWGAAAMILVAELNERLTTLGIAVNLVTYLTATMHVGNAEAANVVTNFMGTSFMLCLLGGFVADSFLGRYLTIAIFTAIQASVSTHNSFLLTLLALAFVPPAAVLVLVFYRFALFA
jgi:dipeptide/tripeptide permease